MVSKETRSRAGYDEEIASKGFDYLQNAQQAWNGSYSGCFIDAKDMAVGRLVLENEKLKETLDLLRNDPESLPPEMAATFCEYKDPLHFHHDGCPSEWAEEQKDQGEKNGQDKV